MLRSRPDAAVWDETVRHSLHLDAEGDGFRAFRQAKQNIVPVRDLANEIRAAGGARRTQFGASRAVIPTVVLEKMKADNPELVSPDREIRQRAWDKWFASTEAKPWITFNNRYV